MVTSTSKFLCTTQKVFENWPKKHLAKKTSALMFGETRKKKTQDDFGLQKWKDRHFSFEATNVLSFEFVPPAKITRTTEKPL